MEGDSPLSHCSIKLFSEAPDEDDDEDPRLGKEMAAGVQTPSFELESSKVSSRLRSGISFALSFLRLKYIILEICIILE